MILRRSAFTLTELVLVVGLISIILVGAVVRLSPQLHRALERHGIAQLCQFEQQVRDYCRKTQTTANLSYDFRIDVIEVEYQARETRRLDVGAFVDLESIRFQNRSNTEDGVITVRADGITPTYAIQFSGRGSTQSGFVLFAGLTGQFKSFNRQQDVEFIMQAIGNNDD